MKVCDNMNHKLTAKIYVLNKLTDTKKDIHIIRVSFYDEKTKVGSAYIDGFDSNKPFLFNFSIYKKYRCKGYGSAAMKYMMQHFKIRYLTVSVNNIPAIKIYKKNNFTVDYIFSDDQGNTQYYMKFSNK